MAEGMWPRTLPGDGVCALQASEARVLQIRLPEDGGNGLNWTGEGVWTWMTSVHPNTAPSPALKGSFLAPEARAVLCLSRK